MRSLWHLHVQPRDAEMHSVSVFHQILVMFFVHIAKDLNRTSFLSVSISLIPFHQDLVKHIRTRDLRSWLPTSSEHHENNEVANLNRLGSGGSVGNTRRNAGLSHRSQSNDKGIIFICIPPAPHPLRRCASQEKEKSLATHINSPNTITR